MVKEEICDSCQENKAEYALDERNLCCDCYKREVKEEPIIAIA